MLKMAKIYLIRHCESEGNACRRAQAQVDALVTAKGYQQNEMLRRRFQDEKIDALYSSDSYRSIMTVDPIARERNLPIHVRMCLREITTGIWEDEAWGNIARDYPELHEVWTRAPWTHTVPGATTFQQVADRMLFGLRRIAREVGDGTALCVSHSCAIKASLCVAMGKPLSCVPEVGHGDNTSVSLLEIDGAGKIRVEYVNDSSHLPAELQRAWSGVAGADVNMEVCPCVCEQEREDARKFAQAAFAQRRSGEPFDGSAWNRETEELLAAHPQYLGLCRLHGEPCGYVRMGTDATLPDDCGFLQEMYVLPEMQGKGYAEQLFGYAAHLFRYEGKEAIAMRRTQDPEQQRVAQRFLFSNLPGCDGMLYLKLFTPPCTYPVLA
jgi:probable phosphoglycerate mutase